MRFIVECFDLQRNGCSRVEAVDQILASNQARPNWNCLDDCLAWGNEPYVLIHSGLGAFNVTRALFMHERLGHRDLLLHAES